MSKLDSVLRYRRHLLSQRQADLAEALAADATLAAEQERRIGQKREVAAEAAAASGRGRLDVAALSARLLYAGQMQAQYDGLARQRDAVAEEVALRRRAVAKADADVRAIEQILDKRAAAERKRQALRDQIRLEEAFAGSRAGDPASDSPLADLEP